MSFARLQAATPGQNTGASGTATATFTSAVAAGSLVHVGVSYYSGSGSNSITGVSDGTANVYAKVATANNVGAGGSNSIDVWKCVTAVGGDLAVVATCSADPGYMTVAVREYSFTPGTLSTVVASASGYLATSAPTGSASFTGNALVTGTVGFSTSGSTSFSWNAGFAAGDAVGYSPGQAFGLETCDVLNTASSPSNPTGTSSTASVFDYAGITVVYQSSGDLVPSAPSVLAATPGNDSVALSWAAGAGASTYSVFRGTTAGGESGTALVTGLTGTTYTDSTAVNGNTYYYTVKGFDTAGSSSASNEASATPSAPTPTLALSPSTSTAGLSATVSLTATLSNASGSLAASTTAGTLSTTAPASGTPFTVETPASGSGTITVAVTGPGGLSATATIAYSASATYQSQALLTPGSTTATYQLYTASGNAFTAVGSPVTSIPVGLSAVGAYTATVTIPVPTSTYLISWTDNLGGTYEDAFQPAAAATAPTSTVPSPESGTVASIAGNDQVVVSGLAGTPADYVGASLYFPGPPTYGPCVVDAVSATGGILVTLSRPGAPPRLSARRPSCGDRPCSPRSSSSSGPAPRRRPLASSRRRSHGSRPTPGSGVFLGSAPTRPRRPSPARPTRPIRMRC